MFHPTAGETGCDETMVRQQTAIGHLDIPECGWINGRKNIEQVVVTCWRLDELREFGRQLIVDVVAIGARTVDVAADNDVV